MHAAAEVNMLKPAPSLSPTNVGGTSHVLSLDAYGGDAVSSWVLLEELESEGA